MYCRVRQKNFNEEATRKLRSYPYNPNRRNASIPAVLVPPNSVRVRVRRVIGFESRFFTVP